MQVIKKIIPILINRYFLVSIGFVVWMIFFDQRDYFQQKERTGELQKVEAAKKYYTDEIEKTKKQLNNLMSTPTAVEKYARERYLLKRDGEEVFLFEDTAKPVTSTSEKK
jgi:cell division protein DivIC